MNKENKKDISKSLVIILAIIVVLLAGGLGFYVFGTSATEPGNTEDVIVTIDEGTATMQVLNELDEAGLVKNVFCGKILVKLSNPEIQAGSYRFTKDMTLTRIFKAMNDHDQDHMILSKVTIIEGATIPQVAADFSAEAEIPEEDILAVWSDKDFLNELIDRYWFITDEILAEGIKYPLEGYLYPETYFIPEENVDVKAVTYDMLDKMDQELTPYKDDIQNNLGFTVHQFLTFCSIVERESLFEDDRPMIAGVFLNRLYEGMALQSDITVLYALGGDNHVDVSIEETQVDSPYNTYKDPGLPIGPICAVPARTMDDCINFEASNFFFFFATEDGDVIYTETYDEHMKVVEENKWY